MPIMTKKREELAPAPVGGGQTQDVSRFTRKRSKKKIILILAILVILAFIAWKALTPKSTAFPVSVTPITYGELTKMVNVSGNIESSATKKVYLPSTLTLGAANKVAKLNVKVGDVVKAGDVLLTLDKTDANRDMEDAKLAFDKANLAYEQAKYEYAVALSGSGVSSSDLNMQNSVTSAVNTYYAIKQEVDNLVDFDFAKFAELRRSYNEAKKALENGTGTADELYDAQALYDNLAQELSDRSELLAKLENAFDALELARNQQDIYLNKAAKERADTAEMTLKAADLSFQQAQRAYSKATDSMGDYVIKAPISGVITESNVKEGEPVGTTGALFTIEDLDSLIVKCAIKEYDVPSVSAGMPVVIKSDATGDAEFEGSVDTIAPTASKTASSVEFPTEIKLLSENSGLRVGMDVRCNIILEKKENVFSVPYDSVVTNAEGQNVIYVMRPGEGEEAAKMFARSVPVEIGMETDFYSEVKSDALAEGDQIITTPTGLTDGMEVMALPAGMVR